MTIRFEVFTQQDTELHKCLQGLVGASVTVTTSTASGEHSRQGTVKRVDDIGVVLLSPTGTEFGIPWEGVRYLTVNAARPELDNQPRGTFRVR